MFARDISHVYNIKHMTATENVNLKPNSICNTE